MEIQEKSLAATTEELFQIFQKRGELLNLNNYKRGYTLYVQGAFAHGVYFIHSGKVKLTSANSRGEIITLGIMKEGDILGIKDCLFSKIHQQTATVLEEVKANFIKKENFFSTLQHSEKEIQLLLQTVLHYKDALEKNYLSMFYRSIRERTAATLLKLSQQFGNQDEDGLVTIEVRLSREEIATMLGTATETLSRTLNEFHDQGLVELKNKKIIMKNIAKVREICT